MKKNKIEYQQGDVVLEGYYAVDDSHPEKKPAILIAHDWSGRREFVIRKVEQLAELGYVGFALDMFGKGKLPASREEKMAFMQPLMGDRVLLRDRVLAGFDCMKSLEFVDHSRLGAMGYCFGGTCVLDLARSGADLRGVVSLHGGLQAPKDPPAKTIKAKVLALHGYEDPMVKADQVRAFEEEMTKANVDWQVYVYGHAMHAFTNPEANDPDFGTVYNKLADHRSWIAIQNFFTEVLF